MRGRKTEVYEQLIIYIQEHQADFYRIAASYLKNPEDAMDAVQNAVCKALEKYRTIRQPEFLKTWFYRILVNECQMMLRNRKKEVLTDEEDTWDIPSTEGVFSEEDYQLYQEVMLLPEKLKTVILLRFYEDMALKEIADITETNLSTVKTRLYQALKILKIQIEGDFL